MVPNVIVFNGGSSSGKSSLTRALQEVLPQPWLRLSVDTLIEACPPRIVNGEGLSIGNDGQISVGDQFTELEQCWMHGVAAMARAGAYVLVEDGFLSGPAAQERWRQALRGLEVLWVGVRLTPELAAAREAQRGDRQMGMAAAQATSVHQGINYDLEIDTATGTPAELAGALARQIADESRR